jgi:hypothetical protein
MTLLRGSCFTNPETFEVLFVLNDIHLNDLIRAKDFLIDGEHPKDHTLVPDWVAAFVLENL